MEVAKLLTYPALSKREWGRAFVEGGHSCRKAFFNNGHQVQSPELVSAIQLSKTDPSLRCRRWRAFWTCFATASGTWVVGNAAT